MLNADDPLVLQMAAHTEAEHICYVTMNPQHALVREHIRAGGRACALEAGVNGQMITLYDRGGHIPLLWTHLIPATLEGRATHNVQNAMFAAAIAFSLGVKLERSARACAPSTRTFFQAPGPHERLRRAPVQGDLRLRPQRARGRDARGPRAAGSTSPAGASSCSPAPATGATRTCAAIARAVAGRFDHYVCRRDDDLRGRAGDEVPRIMAAELTRRRACRKRPISVIPDEQEAIEAALRMGQPGDLLLVFADALVRSWKQIIRFRPEGGAATIARAPEPAAAPAVVEMPVETLAPSSLDGLIRDERGIRYAPRGVRLSEHASAPFSDSRRLTGHNRFFDGPGAVLETAEADAVVLSGWERRVRLACRAFGWPASPIVAITHASGASLAFSAPPDQLFTATEVNEWALAAAIADREPARRATLIAALAAEQPEEPEPPVLEDAGAVLRLHRRAVVEAQPKLDALLDAAKARSLPILLDDEELTIGAGAGHRSWPLADLPDAVAETFAGLSGIPVALVTGTNGKTTVVRLIAACLRATGHRTGHSCTDGVFVDGQSIGSGDYSGPAGARRVLRDRRVAAAVLETARGGILRRGLAVPHADVAVITSIAADHFGEYGIHDLAALAEVKLAVARALDAKGLLVVNADDATLVRKAPGANRRLAWFARDARHVLLTAHRRDGGSTCGVADGQLRVFHGRGEHDLGPVAAMPLAAGGHSVFNVSNLAAAALAATGLGIATETIAAVFARFGRDPADNPGRLMRYEVGGLSLIVDFAHNPAALSGLVDFAIRLRQRGRLAILLGQAGNRADSDIGRLAAVAAAARPELIVVKELTSYLRGRDAGEVPAMLKRALARAGVAEPTVADAPDEETGVRLALGWARAGDVVVLPLHTREGRAAGLALIERLRRAGWSAGQPLPA